MARSSLSLKPAIGRLHGHQGCDVNCQLVNIRGPISCGNEHNSPPFLAVTPPLFFLLHFFPFPPSSFSPLLPTESSLSLLLLSLASLLFLSTKGLFLIILCSLLSV